MQTVYWEDLGMQGYQESWDLQEQYLKENVQLKSAYYQAHQDSSPFALPTTHRFLLVEHPPVYTLGKSGHMENVLLSEAERQARKIEFYKTNRGGDITFHGPGQIVGYPILDLEKFRTDIGWYLRSLEEVIIKTLSHFGIQGDRSPGETGVWIDPNIPGQERKICAMGVRCSRWITMHGFALNVNTDLRYFDHIVPCGIQNKKVASMEQELGQKLPIQEVQSVLLQSFQSIFDVALMPQP
jgi:lipoyl(octanoyl) transferase